MDDDIIDSGESLLVWDQPSKLSDLYTENQDVTVLGSSDEKTDDKTSDVASSVSYIEKCIPNWKQTFSWVCWCSEDQVLFCLHCRELLRRYSFDKIERSNVFHIKNSEGIFTVAKTLRNHHNSQAHVAAIYLYSHGSLLSFVSLFNDHIKEMKTEEEVMEIAKSIFEYTELERDSFLQTIKGIGQFIEKTLVESCKKSKYFSVVADQCRGILIVRWINHKFEIVEHVFWSYLSVWDKTPMQYLTNLGLKIDNVSLYIANTLCQYCRRCENVKVEPASLPPRAPSTISFVNILWKLDFLRPLHSVVSTLFKLYRRYPYKFSHIQESNNFKSLGNFSLKPISAISVMDNFNEIKAVALDLYSKECRTEALGLAMVDLKNDDKHKKILSLLQEIIDTTMNFTVLTKVADDQLVKLSQVFSSLKVKSAGACFVTYSGDSLEVDKATQDEKIWEFLNFVEKFIDENQKGLYYYGKEVVYSFLTFFRVDAFVTISGKLNDKKLASVLKVVLGVFANPKFLSFGERIDLFKCCLRFFQHLLDTKTKMDSCIDMITLFNTNEDLQQKFPQTYALGLYCATLPFLNCDIPRSLFVSFIIEQRIETSLWARLLSDLKPWILYLQHDFQFLSSKDLITWWLSLDEMENV